jgi:hypothetical protein
LARYDKENNKTVFYNDISMRGPDTRTGIEDITEDKNGKLWLATTQGLQVFDPVTEKFTEAFADHDEDMHSLSRAAKKKTGRKFSNSSLKYCLTTLLTKIFKQAILPYPRLKDYSL